MTISEDESCNVALIQNVCPSFIVPSKIFCCEVQEREERKLRMKRLRESEGERTGKVAKIFNEPPKPVDRLRNVGPLPEGNLRLLVKFNQMLAEGKLILVGAHV